MYVSLLLDHMSPEDTCRQGVFLSTSIDMKYCGLALVDAHFKEHIKKFMLSIVWKLLIIGSSEPSHLVFGHIEISN